MSRGVNTPPGVYSGQVLMEQVCRSYKPANNPADWPFVAPGVQSAVIRTEPLRVQTVRDMMGALAQLALFAHGIGLPDDPEIWLAAETIDGFLASGLLGRTKRTRESYEKRLMRLSRAFNDAGGTEKFSASTKSRPYSPDEIKGLWYWARHQSTPRREHSCRVLLCLGRGCGLEPSEIVEVRAHDVRIIKGNGAVVVRVRGARPREVYCRREWERFLAELVNSLAGQAAYLFQPAVHKRETKMISGFLGALPKPPDLPPLSVQRLRATWLVDLLEHRAPLGVVMAAAGLASTAALDSVRPFLKTTEQDEAAEYLRGL